MMMERDYTLEKLRDAKKAHAKWVRRAKHLVENLPVCEDMIPLDSTDCAFGCWLYSEGMKYKNNNITSPILEAIEETHHTLHDIYLRIYRIYFVESKAGFFQRLLFTKTHNAISTQKQVEALKYFEELKGISDALVKQLDNFEIALRDLQVKETHAINY